MIRLLNLTTAGILATVSALIASDTDAHHAPIMYDTSAAVSITGTVVRFEQVAPHSFIIVEQATDSGPVEWAIEGPAPIQLARRRLEDAVRAGDSIEACGYLLREPRTENPRTLMVAEVVVMPDGKARIWSPYGNEHCREQKRYELAEQ